MFSGTKREMRSLSCLALLIAAQVCNSLSTQGTPHLALIQLEAAQALDNEEELGRQPNRLAGSASIHAGHLWIFQPAFTQAMPSGPCKRKGTVLCQARYDTTCLWSGAAAILVAGSSQS